MVSIYNQGIKEKICPCGEPTKRHPSAKYCWSCVAKNNQESAQKSVVKRKAKLILQGK